MKPSDIGGEAIMSEYRAIIDAGYIELDDDLKAEIDDAAEECPYPGEGYDMRSVFRGVIASMQYVTDPVQFSKISMLATVLRRVIVHEQEKELGIRDSK